LSPGSRGCLIEKAKTLNHRKNTKRLLQTHVAAASHTRSTVSIRLIETALSFTTVLCLLQRLPEIRDDIVDILNAHG
jgi:hypothetical protein